MHRLTFLVSVTALVLVVGCDQPTTTPAKTKATTPAAGTTPTVGNTCAADIKKLCSAVQPGEGRIGIVKCLNEHKDALSSACRQVVVK